ncbi:MAG: carboxypeptidase-like regulatory domain-containing protein [bacterium]
MVRTYSILLFGWLLIVSVSHSQTISGFVEDKSTGERLIGANVFDPVLNIGTATNAYGFFSLTFKNLQQDSISLVVSYIGYESWRGRLALQKKLHLRIRLQLTAILADTVMVEAEALGDIAEQTEMSVVQIPVRQLTLMPALLGEVDVIKSLQLLPGVQSGNEGTSGLYIRGGGPDQNLILLDGAPVYNASHLFGFFSVFNLLRGCLF